MDLRLYIVYCIRLSDIFLDDIVTKWSSNRFYQQISEEKYNYVMY